MGSRSIPQHLDDSIYQDPEGNDIDDHGESIRHEDSPDHPGGATAESPRSRPSTSGARRGRTAAAKPASGS